LLFDLTLLSVAVTVEFPRLKIVVEIVFDGYHLLILLVAVAVD